MVTRARDTLWAALLLAGTLESQQPCFDAGSNRNLPFDIFQQAPAPRDASQAGYRYYPLTATASMDLASLNQSRAPIGRYYFLWANRYHGDSGWNKKGNLVFPKITTSAGEVRTFFTTYTKANDCTLAQAARVLDYPAKKVDEYGRRSQLTMAVKGPDVIKQTRDNRLVDVCLLEKEPLTAAGDGILLDYEVQDNRTPEQTLAFLKEFTAVVHGKGKKAILLTNPLDAPTQIHTGVSPSNARAIAEMFDMTTIFLWHKNKQGDVMASAQAQLDMVRKDGRLDFRKLLGLFELNNTTMDDALTARKLVRAESIAAVMFWRNYAEQGGACDSDVNRKIDCLVFGKCAPEVTLEDYARSHTIWALTVIEKQSAKLDPRDQPNNLQPGDKIVSLTGARLTDLDGIAKLRVRDGDREVPLASLKRLHLFLNDNVISRLPAEFFGLQNIAFLYMYDNRLDAIPPEIAGLRNLQGMYFTANNLRAIPPEVFTMTWLRKLQVSRNHLTELPAAIGNLTEMIHFNISSNQIPELPASIERLTKLKVCDFSDNRITRLPEGFAKVRIEHQLRIRNNPITTLPEGFAGMPGSIDITGTKIRVEELSPGLRAQIGTGKR